MASIDHTVIIYKNGEYMEKPDIFNVDRGTFRNLCPFEYTRDGEITDIFSSDGKLVSIVNDIKWYRDEYDAIYERDGICSTSGHRFCWHAMVQAIKWKLHLMKFIYYKHEVGVWKSGDVEIYIYKNDPKSTYVSFYKDSNDTYVVLGGYGHRENPYTHFMNRGYGHAFEKEMATEAYEWLCRDILRVVADSIFDNLEENDDWVREMHKALRYGHEW